MEELYIEGLANHDDRGPCVGAREGAGEASVAARAGTSMRENREVPRSPARPVTGRAAQGTPRRYA